MNSVYQITLLLIGLLLAPVLVGADTASDAETQRIADKPPLRVTTQPLSELTISVEYSAPARVVSLNNSAISAEVSGRALAINFEVGETVKKGKLLVELDCRDYINNKQQALASLKLSQSQLRFANTQFRRNQRLLQRGVVSREAFDQSESNLRTQTADIALRKTSIAAAELAISRCKVYAPFTGQVTNRAVQQGQLVNPGATLLQLLQTDKLEVEAELSVTELDRVKNSVSLKFTTDEQQLPVSLRKAIQQLDMNSNTQVARFSFEGEIESIAGQHGRLKWRDGRRRIPAEYVLQRFDTLGIMIADQGVARFHPLRDAREGQPANVRLPGSTKLIIVNRFSAEHGRKLQID